jgi:transcriptional regulator GlxA family with amidase domain
MAGFLRTQPVLPLVGATTLAHHDPMDIDIIVFDGFDELDAIAPFEVLRNAEELGADLHPALVGLHGPGEITAAHGTRLTVERGVSDRAGMLLVPGGGWNSRSRRGARAEVARGDLPALLRREHARGSTIAAVCTGGMVLAAAGITRGRPATTHRLAQDELRASGAEVVDARVVDDGDVLTAGGVTSGLDLALHIVERFAGAEIAGLVAAEIEPERAGEVWAA